MSLQALYQPAYEPAYWFDATAKIEGWFDQEYSASSVVAPVLAFGGATALTRRELAALRKQDRQQAKRLKKRKLDQEKAFETAFAAAEEQLAGRASVKGKDQAASPATGPETVTVRGASPAGRPSARAVLEASRAGALLAALGKDKTSRGGVDFLPELAVPIEPGVPAAQAAGAVETIKAQAVDLAALKRKKEEALIMLLIV